MDREALVFRASDTLFYVSRSLLKAVSMKELNHDLNMSQSELYLWPVDEPGRKITCEISLKGVETELTIRGLMFANPISPQKI
jgi:hypothetical protein